MYNVYIHVYMYMYVDVPYIMVWFILSRFQMRIHHPFGCHDDASGGWAANDAQWKVRGVVKVFSGQIMLYISEKSGATL